MVERHLNVIELKGFSAAVMEILLNSIYGESVTVTSDNVQDILPAASLLQLNGTGLIFFISFVELNLYFDIYQIFKNNVLSSSLVILNQQIVWAFIVLLIYIIVHN
jgi:hypothetical protein